MIRYILAILLALLPLSAQAMHGHHHHHGKHHAWHMTGKKLVGEKSSKANAEPVVIPFSIPMFDAQDAAGSASDAADHGSSTRGNKHASERKVMHHRPENGTSMERHTRPSAHLPAGAVALFKEYEDWKRFLRERELFGIFRETEFGNAFAAAGGK